MNQDFILIDPKHLSDPRNGVQSIYLDCWWSCDEQGRVAFYPTGRQKFGRHPVAPQCNSDKRIAEQISKRLGFTSGPVQVPAVYLSWSEFDGSFLLPAELELSVTGVAS